MLFNTIAEIKEFLPVGVANDFNRIKPHIAAAENKYIKTLLGSDAYTNLLQFHEATYPDAPTEIQKANKQLLEKIQHALIHLAYFTGYDFLNVSVSDAGFQRMESEKMKGLFHYQEENLKKYFGDTGFNGLDDALVFLENNTEFFPDFANSANFTVLKKSFFPTVASVEKVPFNLHGSRLTFLALQPALAYSEETEILKIMGSENYQELKAQMEQATMDEKYIQLIPLIQKALIYLASAMLMEETGATLNERGLFFETFDPIYRGTKTKAPATESRVAFLSVRNRNIGLHYLEALKNVISVVWPEYTNVTGVFNRDNTDKKTFWT